MEKEGTIVQFIKYNNTIPIVLGILFLSSSVTFAASPQAREAVYKATTEVQTVDNSYIATVTLDTYPFAIRVTGVTEDADRYYIAYDFETIDVVDYVWQDALKKGVMQVFKSQLKGGDLKEYAEIEFAQLRAAELTRLKETQVYERSIGVSQKTVATAYTGLVGKFIEPNNEALPFYQPPPELQNKDSALALKKPARLITWDENAQPEPEVVVTEEPREEEEDNTPSETPTDPQPTDACPNMEGMQTSAEECPVVSEEPPSEEPPVEEPVVENPEPEPAAEEPAP